ncbi:MAG: T9SS type A sorting domain-containing protein [Luteibaculum sp.]
MIINKILILTSVNVCFLVNTLFSQQNPKNELVTFNNLKVNLQSTFPQFMGSDGRSPGFFFPKDSSTATIFAQNFWMSAVSGSTQKELLTAGTFRGLSGADWYCGPNIQDTLSDPQYFDKYDRIWLISKAMVDDHRANFSSPQYTMPEVISNWPAKKTAGQSDLIAPFVDVNTNNIYDPQNGDYPLIKGDKAVLILSNDKGVHTNSNSDQGLDAVIFVMYYAYENVSDLLDRTLFTWCGIKNTSAESWTDFRFGAWLDFDLGFPSDDYVGTNVNQNAIYVYNADGLDDTDTTFGQYGYGENPPVQSFKLLDREIISSASYYTGNTHPGINRPTSAAHYSNFIQGKWKDGEEILYGGIGRADYFPDQYPYGTLSTEATARFVFPGNSDPTGRGTQGTDKYGETEIWTEQTAGNATDDRKMLGVFEIQEVLPNDLVAFHSAHVTTLPSAQERLFEDLESDLLDVQNFFDNQSTGLRELGNSNEVSLFPNPGTNRLHIAGQFLNLSILDQTGKTVITSGYTKSIDVSALDKGLYQVQVEHSNGKIYTQKWIKQ